MTNLSKILSLQNVQLDLEVSSKKRAFEQAGLIFADRTRPMAGMNAVIMDNAVIGSRASSEHRLCQGRHHRAPRSLVLATPARITRPLRDHEITWKRQGTMQYHELTERSIQTMRAVAPLTEMQENRARIRVKAHAAPKIRSQRAGK
jgi:hypothetical protein